MLNGTNKFSYIDNWNMLLQKQLQPEVWSWSLPFQGNSNFGLVCFIRTKINFCCSLFNFCSFKLRFKLKFCLYTISHLLLEEFRFFSQVILKYTNITSWSRSPKFSNRSPTKNKDAASLVPSPSASQPSSYSSSIIVYFIVLYYPISHLFIHINLHMPN